MTDRADRRAALAALLEAAQAVVAAHPTQAAVLDLSAALQAFRRLGADQWDEDTMALGDAPPFKG